MARLLFSQITSSTVIDEVEAEQYGGRIKEDI